MRINHLQRLVSNSGLLTIVFICVVTAAIR